MQFENNLLIKKIKQQIQNWFETENVEYIPNDEVYRFLHSIKETAGTIQLGGILHIATELLEKIEQNEKKNWEINRLRDFLYRLIEVSYEYEYFQEVEIKPYIPRNENAPLIQIIDDDVSMLFLLKDTLEEKGWIVIANTEPEKATEQYFNLHPDCLIIDINLPNKNGIQLLEDIQMYNKQKFIPKVMISVENNREIRMRAYQKGADDFIAKPIDIEELVIRVERQLQRKQIFDQSVLLDEMTKVFNRRFFTEMFGRNIKNLHHSKNYFSIALLDLDNFKDINDKYGHLVGDRVLISFALFLKENIRCCDYVFRYGGEEFVLLLSNTNNTEAVNVINRLLTDFSKMEFQNEKQEKFTVTFSTGIFFVHDPSVTVSHVIQSADEALYHAKENGRARIITSNEMIRSSGRNKLHISIVDDDAIVRTMLVKVLQSMKFDHYDLTIQSFEDGQKLFQSKRTEEPGNHFLILDGIMPVMDGIEILQRVKQGKNKERFNVLMLTARKSDYDIARALKLGADDYVTKPFSITELQARIQRLIQRIP